MAKIKSTSREIEERYVVEDRGIGQERSDFLLPQILDFVSQKKWMNLQPEYQRRQVWDKTKQSQFLESLIMNLPIPPVFLFEPEYNRYEVMDGQQRLSSIVAFYSNRLKLTGLEYWPELNGKYYADLPTMLQRGLDRRRISAVVLQSNAEIEHHDEIRRVVFERLNTGGQKLNAQELRNCIYASPFSDLLVDLAGYPTFNDLWEIPRYEDHFLDGHVSQELSENGLFKRMIDCELVLRFFALRERKNIKGSVKSILDRCMDVNRNASEDELEEMRFNFQSRIDLASELFGLNAFKIRELDSGKEKTSPPFYDAIIISCDRQFEKRDKLFVKRKSIIKEINSSMANDDNYELIVGRANTADAIRKRLDFVESIFSSVL